MTTKIKTIAIAMLTIFNLATTKLNAQDKTVKSKTTISVETDPLTYLFDGYSLHIRIKPKGSDKLLVGAGMLLGPLFTTVTLPDFFVNANADNKNKGWGVEIKNGYSLFGEYFFNKVNHKWFVGEQLGVQSFRLKNTATTDEFSDYNQLMLMTYGGYSWHPFKFPLYIKPWVGIGYSPNVGGSNILNGLEYKVSPITPFVTFHIGYTF
jgi:hypothetical protein